MKSGKRRGKKYDREFMFHTVKLVAEEGRMERNYYVTYLQTKKYLLLTGKYMQPLNLLQQLELPKISEHHTKTFLGTTFIFCDSLNKLANNEYPLC